MIELTVAIRIRVTDDIVIARRQVDDRDSEAANEGSCTGVVLLESRAIYSVFGLALPTEIKVFLLRMTETVRDMERR